MPCVVGEPTQSMFSLMVKGTPCNGPEFSLRSAASAPSSAVSASVRVTALTWPLTSAMRSRWAWTTSRLETSRSRIRAASSTAVRFQSASGMGGLLVVG